MALCDVGERDAFGGKHAAAILERHHGLRSPGAGAGATGGAAGGGADPPGGDDTGAGNPGVAAGAGVGNEVADEAGDAADDASGVAAGTAAFAGGSFSGPLMPHDTIASAVSETIRVATKRRNIRLLELYALDTMCNAIDEQSITRRGDACMTTESEFVALADRVLMAIGAALDVAADTSDADLDWSLNDGILAVDCGGGGKIIVNRHVANRELWVAAKSGGFHFKGDAGAWRDTRSGDALATVLTRLLQAQSGVEIAFVLPGPG
jgi:CyaY protein